jgi:hypothetical protein
MPSKRTPRSQAQSVLSGLFERGEEVVGVFLEELSRNPRVREQLGKTVERAVGAKRAVDKNMQTLLSALNLPSRADHHRVLTKIEALQGSLVNLSLKVDRLLAAQQSHAAPSKPAPRARKHPAKK